MKKPGKPKKKHAHRGSKRCKLSQLEGRKLAKKMRERALEKKLEEAA